MNLQFDRTKQIKGLNIKAVPLILGGGYDISGGDTRLAWCAGLSQFFWTPFWPKMTKGLKEILRCAPRDQVIIMSGNPTPFRMLRSFLFNLSLKQLGLDKIDIWLELWVKDKSRFDLHNMEWVKRKKEENKLGLFGISTHRHEVVEAALNREDIDVIMIRYNAAHKYYDHIFNAYRDLVKTKLIISYTSTKWGYLVKRDSDWPLQNDIPTAADCYAYALDNKGIDCVLFGPKNREELEKAFDLFRYSSIEWYRRKEVLEEYGKYIYKKYGVKNLYQMHRKFFVLPR